MAAFKSAKGHPGNMAKPKFSLFPADVFVGGIFWFLGWDGRRISSNWRETQSDRNNNKKKRHLDVMMMTTTKSHEIVFDTKSYA